MVHVVLAEIDLVGVLLEAADEVLAEALAGILLGGWLRVLLLLLLVVLRLGLLLLLLLRGFLSVRGGATAHHCADCLMSDFGACAESHTSDYCRHNSTAAETHSAALLGSGSRSVLNRSGWRCGCA